MIITLTLLFIIISIIQIFLLIRTFIIIKKSFKIITHFTFTNPTSIRYLILYSFILAECFYFEVEGEGIVDL